MKSASSGFMYHDWGRTTNVPNPEHYIDDFSSDRGYFSELNNTHNWKIENGTLHTTAELGDVFVTSLHIYEKNVSVKARIRYTGENPPSSIFGILMRYCAEEAFVRISYRAYKGIFAIDSRDGNDFPVTRHIQVNYKLNEGEWYEFFVTLSENELTFTVNGELIASLDNVSHMSPGRVGFFAERITCEVDSTDIAFLSGIGTLWKDCVHNILPDDVYREGGSAVLRLDGSLTYQHHSGACFTSKDNGATWEKRDTWFPPSGYMGVIRLLSGKLLRISYRLPTGDKMVHSLTSSDDGETWDMGGIITEPFYNGNPQIGAGNMNDKLMQGTTGRIYYSQCYETRPYAHMFDVRSVFCTFYYSDDEGKSWIKSENESWNLGGNLDNNVQWYGECKLLECADGTVRMYNSWNSYGCVTYADSHDGGKTFGKLEFMPELVCARSSMQFCRDPYADNDTTYYMVLVYSPTIPHAAASMGRSRLAVLKSEDGKSWSFLGDAWRNEMPWHAETMIAHCVDPFITVTQTHVIVGSGIAEELGAAPKSHNAQRQHIWTVPKSSLRELPIKPV